MIVSQYCFACIALFVFLNVPPNFNSVNCIHAYLCISAASYFHRYFTTKHREDWCNKSNKRHFSWFTPPNRLFVDGWFIFKSSIKKNQSNGEKHRSIFEIEIHLEQQLIVVHSPELAAFRWLVSGSKGRSGIFEGKLQDEHESVWPQ